jgi:hypothetical protein
MAAGHLTADAKLDDFQFPRVSFGQVDCSDAQIAAVDYVALRAICRRTKCTVDQLRCAFPRALVRCSCSPNSNSVNRSIESFDPELAIMGLVPRWVENFEPFARFLPRQWPKRPIAQRYILMKRATLAGAHDARVHRAGCIYPVRTKCQSVTVAARQFCLEAGHGRWMARGPMQRRRVALPGMPPDQHPPWLEAFRLARNSGPR